jgi:solute:Na+ symporter, SSS family
MNRAPHVLLLSLAAAFASVATPAGAAPEPGDGDIFELSFGPALPEALTGAAVGRAAGRLLVAGGQTADGAVNPRVYALAADGRTWEGAGVWDTPAVEPAAAETGRGLLCAGGRVDGAWTRRVVLLAPQDNGSVAVQALPDLPFAVEGARAVGIGNTAYLVGRRAGITADDPDAAVFLALNVAAGAPAWQSLEPCPGPARTRPAMAVLQGQIYVFGGEDGLDGAALRDAHRHAPGRTWTSLAEASVDLTGRWAAPCGQSHLLLLGGAEPAADMLAYHAITDTWVVLGHLPKAVSGTGVSAVDKEFALVDGATLLQGKAVVTPTKYGWLDHGVVVVYAVAMLMIGGVLARRERGTGDYFRAGQRIPWWASGLSLFATGASAISLMAMPGKAYAEDWAYFSISIYSALMLPLVIVVFVPIARRLKVSTSNEYLERRFNMPIRLFGGVIFSLNQMLARMASVMLLPSIAISAIAGIPMETSILIMGVITTIYVTMGGLEAVVWTDVIQALVMLLSVLTCIVWALVSLHADWDVAWQLLQERSKLRIFDTRFDILQPTVYLMSINILVTTLAVIGDQNFIQRVQCTRDERQARKAVITQMSVAVPLNFVLFSLGTVLFLFYRERPEMLNPAMWTDGIFPLFAAQMLPAGIAGLVVASLLAATMSTLSSAVNSVANVGVEDFYRRLFKGANERGALLLGRILSVLLGVFGTAAALVLARTTLTSVWDLAILVTGIVASPIAGIFTLGIFTRRANSTGVVLGSVAAIATAVYAKYGMNVHPFFNLAAGVTMCIVVGYLGSLLFPSKPRDLAGLTVYTLTPRGDDYDIG